nr:hypothetical protein [Tanacetum cinerariifolium]
MEGIKREFSVARTPQQNGIVERKNKTLIEAARTMLADSLLPIPFWSEAVNTACYVQNRVLVTKPHNKTPFELLLGKTPSMGFMRPFGYPVTILNILDPLGKFDGKADEGFLVGYSASRSRPTWLFDIDTLTKSMNYQPNTDDDTTFEVKEPKFELKKPESAVHVSPRSSAKTKKHDDKTIREAKGKSSVELSTRFRNLSEEFEDFSDNSINEVNTAVSPTHGKSSYVDTSQYPDDPNMPALEDITYSDNEEIVHKDHHVTQIIGDLSSAPQTRSMTRMVKEQGGLTQINNDDFHTCMFACFLSQEEPKRVHQAFKDPIWIEAMHKELLQFKMQKEEGIDYEEVFAPVVRIEAIRSFLAYASFMGFMVYQMDVKSAFLYETIKEEVYVCQPLGFEDPDYLDKVYKVVKALYGLHQAPRAWYETLANYVLENGFHRGRIDQTLFIKKKKDGKSASTPIDTEKPLLKDPDGEDVDVHTYRSMIGSLMYLTSSRPDIMFAVCACAYFQVTPKALYLHASKRIFRYLKGKPNLGLWYPKDSSFNLVAYSDSDYAGASLDRKSTTGGCQFLRCRLISWQCKKKTVVATSSTEANQLLDYGRKVIITEDTVCQALHLDDDESIDCLPNEEIFTKLARNSSSKFYMYLRFLQLMISAQAIDDVANVAADDVDDVVAEDVAEPTPPSPTPATTPPPPQQEVISTLPPSPHQSPSAPPSSPLPQHSQPSHDAAFLMDLLNTLLETYTTLTRKVEALEQDKIAQDLEIIKLKQRVRKLEKKRKLKVSGLRRLKKDDEPEPAELKEVIEVVTTAKLMTEVVTAAAAPITAATITAAPSTVRRRNEVVIRDHEETATPSTIVHSEPKSKDKGKGILVEEPKPLKKQAHIEQDEAYARDLEVPGLKEETTNRSTGHEEYDGFLEKGEEQLEEEASKALKRKSKSSEQQAAKKQKLDEKVQELKKHIQIVPNDEDDVYIEATPLALKMIFLVERRYPLTRFTLDQMLNDVRLEIKEESEVSLELLRFVRRQQQEGYRPDFGVDAVEDFKEYTLRDYYCWLKTYCCWYKLKQFDNAADSRLRLLEESVAADDKMKK